MTTKLKVAFENPNAGWVTLTINQGGQTISLTASYIYDSFLQLTYTLHSLLFGQGQAIVTWLTEPVEYEMRFAREADTLHLAIHDFPDRRRSPFLGRPLLTLSGSYEEVCLPFWRALRALQGRFSEQELHERWQRPFPSGEIAKLTQALEERSKAGP